MASAPRITLARARARAVLDELEINTLPVIPERIAAAKNIAIEERSEFPKEVYGAIAYANGRVTIFVSRACPTPGHRRFTLGHELAHFCIEGHLDAQMVGGSEVAWSAAGHYRRTKDPIEIEADAFASELLMPERLVRPKVARAKRDLLDFTLGLADDAEVSIVAAGIRTTELMDGLGAVIISRGATVEWASFSPSLWGYDFARRSWRGEWAPRGSAAFRFGRDSSAVLAGKRDASDLQLCEWFEDAPPQYEVEEESLGLGTYGRVLTLLRVPYLPDADSLYLKRQRERDDSIRADRDYEDGASV